MEKKLEIVNALQGLKIHEWEFIKNSVDKSLDHCFLNDNALEGHIGIKSQKTTQP